MVASVGVSGSSSFLTRSLFPPGQLLLAARCQELPQIQQIAEPTERTNENAGTDHLNGGQPTDPSELINAAAPRVSCCLLEASKALSEKRIEDLCAQLVQASTILDEVLVAVSPMTETAEPDAEMSVTVEPETPVDLPPIPEGELTTVIELPRAMAAAA